MGAGGALFDYDNDGDLDVFLLQNQSIDPAPPAPGRTHRLFRNELIEKKAPVVHGRHRWQRPGRHELRHGRGHG